MQCYNNNCTSLLTKVSNYSIFLLIYIIMIYLSSQSQHPMVLVGSERQQVNFHSIHLLFYGSQELVDICREVLHVERCEIKQSSNHELTIKQTKTTHQELTHNKKCQHNFHANLPPGYFSPSITNLVSMKPLVDSCTKLWLLELELTIDLRMH